MVTDSWTIARHYLLSLGFCLDVASVLPLEVFSLAWVATPHFWGYMALFRTNRLIKLWKVMGGGERGEGGRGGIMRQWTLFKSTTP